MKKNMDNHFLKIISSFTEQDKQKVTIFLNKLKRKADKFFSSDFVFMPFDKEIEDIIEILTEAIPLDDTYSNPIQAGIQIKIESKDFEKLMILKDCLNKDIIKTPEYGWVDKKNGEYQFGKKTFSQKGKKRKKVFTALMDTYQDSPTAISVKTIKEKTGLDARRIRIEINAISKKLSDDIGLYFKGSGKGYYTLEKPSKSSK